MELRDYLAVAARRKVVILAVAAVVVGTALTLSFLQTPVYQASSRVLLRPTISVYDARLGQQAQSPVLVETEIQVYGSEQVGSLVRERLNGEAPAVAVTSIAGTAVVEITARSTDPNKAVQVSNAYVDAHIEFRRNEAAAASEAAAKDVKVRVDGLQRQKDELDSQLAALPSCTVPIPPRECDARPRLNQERDSLVTQLAPLEQRLTELQLGTSVASGPQVIAPAAASPEPVSPRPVRNGLLGLGVGLTFGIALAFALEHVDDSIKSKEDLERIARELPVLGMIPTVTIWKNRAQTRVLSQSDPTSSVAEAYRSLRTSIRFTGLDRSMRTIQITSPNAAEGKTTTVANLAIALARAGERVVIVGCDLRRPRIHEFFDLPNDVGFMSVILGEMPLSSALQIVPNESRFKLLATGPIPANPSEVLSSNRAGQVLAALRKEFSIVLIDSPPVLPVTDAAVLSAHVDGTVLVAAVGTTTGKQVSRSLELLRQVGAPLVGMVLNGVGAQGAYGYTGYYGPLTAGGSAKPRKSSLSVRDESFAAREG